MAADTLLHYILRSTPQGPMEAPFGGLDRDNFNPKWNPEGQARSITFRSTKTFSDVQLGRQLENAEQEPRRSDEYVDALTARVKSQGQWRAEGNARGGTPEAKLTDEEIEALKRGHAKFLDETMPFLLYSAKFEYPREVNFDAAGVPGSSSAASAGSGGKDICSVGSGSGGGGSSGGARSYGGGSGASGGGSSSSGGGGGSGGSSCSDESRKGVTAASSSWNCTACTFANAYESVGSSILPRTCSMCGTPAKEANGNCNGAASNNGAKEEPDATKDGDDGNGHDYQNDDDGADDDDDDGAAGVPSKTGSNAFDPAPADAWDSVFG